MNLVREGPGGQQRVEKHKKEERERERRGEERMGREGGRGEVGSIILAGYSILNASVGCERSHPWWDSGCVN